MLINLTRECFESVFAGLNFLFNLNKYVYFEWSHVKCENIWLSILCVIGEVSNRLMEFTVNFNFKCGWIEIFEFSANKTWNSLRVSHAKNFKISRLTYITLHMFFRIPKCQNTNNKISLKNFKLNFWFALYFWPLN